MRRQRPLQAACHLWTVPAPSAQNLDLVREHTDDWLGDINPRRDDMLKWLIRVTIPALGALVPLAAHAADPTYCQQYAQAAIVQVQAALAVGTCSPGAQGPRWSTSPQFHFKWCLLQAPQAVAREAANRTGFIRSCRGY